MLLTVSDRVRHGRPDGGELLRPFFTTKACGQGDRAGAGERVRDVSGVGGHIRVKSSPGKGTVFTILVPVVASVAVPEPWPIAPAGFPGASDLNILLGEDEEAVLTLAAGILRRRGYRVLTASNGMQALAALGDDVGLKADMQAEALKRCAQVAGRRRHRSLGSQPLTVFDAVALLRWSSGVPSRRIV